MSVRRAMSALVVAALFAMAASPAMACKGAESLLRDDFTEADPAWSVWWPDNSSFDIADGKVTATNNPGYWGVMSYDGAFFPAADACVDITMPAVRDPAGVWAGIVFTSGDATYAAYVTPDGKSGVTRANAQGWLDPVKPKVYPAIKTGDGATNTLRVVWSGPPAEGSNQPADPTIQVFVNDQALFKFKVKPNTNRQLGLGISAEGATFVFSNLSVTQ